MDPISRSIANAPPGQTGDEWARTTAEGRMFTVMRELTEPQQESWLMCLRRIVGGMPVREATLLMYRECGLDEAEAEKLADRVLGDGA